MMTSALVGVGAPVSADHYDRDYDREYDRDYDRYEEKKVVIMHTGDIHGDLRSHTNAREDSNGMLEGGLARAATVIKKIKYKYGDKLIWGHTGDTMSGSAMATFTQGKALIDVWDALSPDVFATGNWEYNYGVYRYLKFFGADGDITAVDPADESSMNFPPYEADGSSYADGNIYTGLNARKAMKADQNGEVRRWRTIAANAYFNGDNAGPGIVNKGIGELLTDPYLVKTVNGVKIGFIGCTTNRGPQVVSSNITRGISFTNCMGDVKFPQNQPIKWANSTTYPDGMHPNRNIAKEKPDEGGFGTATP
jgi:sulfur-oxidizing protein SoxB